MVVYVNKRVTNSRNVERNIWAQNIGNIKNGVANTNRVGPTKWSRLFRKKWYRYKMYWQIAINAGSAKWTKALEKEHGGAI